MVVGEVTKFERFFRAAAGLDVDKQDLKRYYDFLNQKVYDLLIIAQAAAKANRRDVLEPYDLPVTKGLQEIMYVFRDLDQEIEVAPVLDRLTARPPLDVTLSEETQERLPLVVGGLSMALARAFKIIDPETKNPQTRDWERVQQLFELLL
ncbi:DUF1931 family protein [Sphaerisporangium album]|uniref:DUF1931 family protein n=1 Tax=Sphaerisporangium album TaxID=509200 RepID=A0A367FL37_9ACTN|nr:DUF1931 family protein [Sphaerisporangium album]RCG31108.1 DUF1931 family protein [Sphaerisporangium album]